MAVIDDIILVQMQRPGVDGAGISPPEKAQLVNDVATALARANITGVAAIPDVTLSGLAEGDVLVYEGGQWRNGSQPGAIDGVYTRVGSGWTQISTQTTGIYVGPGVSARQGSGGSHAAVIEVDFGSSGNSNAVAREDHAHSVRTDEPFPFDASGALSSGSRTLVSGTVSGLDAARAYILTGNLEGDLRGGGSGAGYTLPRITIAGSNRDRYGGSRGEVRTVSGVDRSYTMGHPGAYVSGVTSVSVSASIAYRSGDPVTVGAGELVIKIKANR